MNPSNINFTTSLRIVLDTIPRIISIILFFAIINLVIFTFKIFYIPDSDIFHQIYIGLKFILSAIFIGSVIFIFEVEQNKYSIFEKFKIGRTYYLKLLACIPFALIFYISRFYNLIPIGLIISIQLIYVPYFIIVKNNSLKDGWNRSIETFKNISFKDKIFLLLTVIISYLIYRLISMIFNAILDWQIYSLLYYFKLFTFYILFYSVLSIPFSLIYKNKMLDAR
jgi:hypothetical protein